MTILAVSAIAYLLGSIPFGLLLTRAAGLGDIRAVGSGNIGATNVMRTGRKELGMLTLLLDMGKGYAAVYLAPYVFDYFSPDEDWPVNIMGYWIAPIAVTVGHCYPLWLKFEGGKGVATALGAMLALGVFYLRDHYALGIALLAVWLTVFAIWRMSSLASLVTFGASPFITFFVAYHSSGGNMMVALAICATIPLPVSSLIIWRHKGNIRRLLNGTERSFRKEKP